MNGTKTVTVLFEDEPAAVERWARKGWHPVSITHFSESHRSKPRDMIVYSTIVLARMGKPK